MEPKPLNNNTEKCQTRVVAGDLILRLVGVYIDLVRLKQNYFAIASDRHRIAGQFVSEQRFASGSLVGRGYFVPVFVEQIFFTVDCLILIREKFGLDVILAVFPNFF